MKLFAMHLIFLPQLPLSSSVDFKHTWCSCVFIKADISSLACFYLPSLYSWCHRQNSKSFKWSWSQTCDETFCYYWKISPILKGRFRRQWNNWHCLSSSKSWISFCLHRPKWTRFEIMTFRPQASDQASMTRKVCSLWALYHLGPKNRLARSYME